MADNPARVCWRIALIAILGLPFLGLAGCGANGADFDKELALKSDGLVYKLGEDDPYTGEAGVNADCAPLFQEHPARERAAVPTL